MMTTIAATAIPEVMINGMLSGHPLGCSGVGFVLGVVVGDVDGLVTRVVEEVVVGFVVVGSGGV